MSVGDCVVGGVGKRETITDGKQLLHVIEYKSSEGIFPSLLSK